MDRPQRVRRQKEEQQRMKARETMNTHRMNYQQQQQNIQPQFIPQPPAPAQPSFLAEIEQ